MIIDSIRISNYCSREFDKQAKSLIGRLGKSISKNADCLFTLIDKPDLPLYTVIDKGWQGHTILAYSPHNHSIKINGFDRKKASSQGDWNKVWLYRPIKRTETPQGEMILDESDWFMPFSPEWRPSCWLSVKEISELPFYLLDRVLARLDNPHNKKKLRKYMSKWEIKKPDNKTMSKLYHGELNSNLHLNFDSFVNYILSKQKEGLTGWELIKRCPERESFHIDCSGFPLKYVNINYLIWLVIDRRIKMKERFPGFDRDEKKRLIPKENKGSFENHQHPLLVDKETRKIIKKGYFSFEKFFEAYDPLKTKILEFLKKPENDWAFKAPYSCSNSIINTEEEYEIPWRQNYPTGRWGGKIDPLPWYAERGGMTEDEFLKYTRGRKINLCDSSDLGRYRDFINSRYMEPPLESHRERFDSLGTNKYHKWLWQGRTPFSKQDEEEQDEYEDLELGTRWEREEFHSNKVTNQETIEDLQPRIGPQTEEETISALLDIQDRAEKMLRYVLKFKFRPILTQKEERQFAWDKEDIFNQISLWKKDITHRIWAMVEGLNINQEWVTSTVKAIKELEIELLND